MGKAFTIKCPANIGRIAIGDPSVADLALVAPGQIYVSAKAVGLTNLTLWDSSDRSWVWEEAAKSRPTPVHLLKNKDPPRLERV